MPDALKIGLYSMNMGVHRLIIMPPPVLTLDDLEMVVRQHASEKL